MNLVEKAQLRPTPQDKADDTLNDALRDRLGFS